MHRYHVELILNVEMLIWCLHSCGQPVKVMLMLSKF